VNASTAFARVLVDELVRGGVREVVLAPGSRSAPLAFALHAADRERRLRLHVRVDERSAAFLALGLGRVAGVPAAVLTTSGTATANLHPAVLEAAHADVPLLLLTADRPPELRGTGANQTVEQVGVYGGAVRWAADVATPEQRPGQQAYWRAVVCQALSAATGDLGGAPGPVHLNLPLREPLVPDGDDTWLESLAGRADGRPWTQRLPGGPPPRPPDDLPDRTVVVLGDGAPAAGLDAQRLAAVRGWPVVAEPSAAARVTDEVLAVPSLLLAVPGLLDALRPERVLVVGRPTLTRPVSRLVASGPTDVVASGGRWPDPARSVRRVLPTVPRADGGPVDPDWLGRWQQVSLAAGRAAQRLLDARPGLAEPRVAGLVLGAVPAGGLLVVGSSKPVRDLGLWRPREGIRVVANRGVAGIDGVVSTAVGAALAAQADGGGPAFALLGDLTFLHDTNGLLIGPTEPRPDLAVVVVDNDGGGIFSLLEQGGDEHADAFERVFGTPHGTDLAALCAATRTPYARAGSAEDLARLLEPSPGLRVVHVRTDRAAAAGLDRDLRSVVADAVRPLLDPPG
jgi:2-succinyl-5-enolpyruvyl-6-hydroxy-3-cyclohexene-1-carboxylate synthase